MGGCLLITAITPNVLPLSLEEAPKRPLKQIDQKPLHIYYKIEHETALAEGDIVLGTKEEFKTKRGVLKP